MTLILDSKFIRKVLLVSPSYGSEKMWRILLLKSRILKLIAAPSDLVLSAQRAMHELFIKLNYSRQYEAQFMKYSTRFPYICIQTMYTVLHFSPAGIYTTSRPSVSRMADYRQVSNIRRTLVGNMIVDHSDVVGASPVGAAPTTSSFST